MKSFLSKIDLLSYTFQISFILLLPLTPNFFSVAFSLPIYVDLKDYFDFLSISNLFIKLCALGVDLLLPGMDGISND